MRVFALGDLHLSFSRRVEPDNWEQVEEYKPMDCFGEHWRGHYRKIYQNWQKRVSAEDLVLIPGDISWASSLEELAPDLDFLAALPGEKVLVKGNHDFWWQGIGKAREVFPEDFHLIQNDSYAREGITIAGSRGWTVPGSFQFDEHDRKIYQRELNRLELSLRSIQTPPGRLLVMLHYMPVNENHEHNELITLLKEYGVEYCVYGHLHGEISHGQGLRGEKWGIEFHLVSADFIDFSPVLIMEL